MRMTFDLLTSSWTRKCSTSFTTACDNPGTLKSMSSSSTMGDFFHLRVSPFLLSAWCPRDQTRYRSRSPWWILVHRRVKQVSLFKQLGFWFWLDSLGVFAASSDLWIQFFHPIYLWKKSSVVVEVTRILSRIWSTDFHHNNFRDTVSWECIVKDDWITSCLIILQSFSFSRLYIDPIHRILVSFPLLLLVRCKTWFWSNQAHADLCDPYSRDSQP